MKQRIINFLFRKLLNAVVLEDVLKEFDKKLYIGGKEIGEIELRSLISEIKALENMRIWNIINETLKYEALDTGWNKSTNIDQLNTGKTIYYTLDVQRSIIKKIKSREKK